MNRWGQMGLLSIPYVLMHKTIGYFVWAYPWKTTSAAYILQIWYWWCWFWIKSNSMENWWFSLFLSIAYVLDWLIIPIKKYFSFVNSLSPLSGSDFTSWEHGLLSKNNYASLPRSGKRKKYGLQRKQVQWYRCNA